MKGRPTLATVPPRRVLGKVAAGLFLGVLPILSIPVLSMLLMRNHQLAFDFHGWYWPAGHRILRGTSPYTFGVEQAFNYPAFGGLVLSPFALLSRGVADVVFTACVLAAVPATLRLLGVRDWRVLGATLLWPPVVFGWETANVTLLLALGVAVAWRCRDRQWVVAGAVAAVVSVKLFLIPLFVWLLVTRRYGALLRALLLAIGISAAAWLVVGTNELAQYNHTLRLFAATAEHRGYSLISLLLQNRVGERAAYALALLAAACVLIAGLRAASAAAGPRQADRLALTACVGASLIGSPVMESHYLSLLLIPLALARPGLCLAWALPLVLWLAPVDHPAAWQRVLALAVAVALLVVTLRGGSHYLRRGRPLHVGLGQTGT